MKKMDFKRNFRGNVQAALVFLAFVFLGGVGFAQAPDFIWASRAGGMNEDFGRAIATDKFGNSFLTGEFEGLATFDTFTLTSAGGRDMFVAKYDTVGNVLWVRRAGGTSGAIGYGIATDVLNNCFITGWFGGTATFDTITLTSAGDIDIFITKYDTSGHVLWAKGAGGANRDLGLGVSTDRFGNVLVTGYFHDAATFDTIILTSAGLTDIFIAKYDILGNVLWAKKAGGVSSAIGYEIATDVLGNSFITGVFEGTATFDTITLTSAGGYDIFITKYDTSGNVLWARRAGGTDNDFGESVATDASGDCVITGQFSRTATFDTFSLTDAGGGDVFIAKYGASGNILWAKRAGGPAYDFGRGIAIDESDNISIIGDFDGTATFGTTTLTSVGDFDIFIVQCDTSGNNLWAKHAGSMYEDDASDIATDCFGNNIVTGFFPDTAYFGATTLTSAGNRDIFVAKIGAMPDPFTKITAGDIVNDGSKSNGACWGDYDDDGDLDLFVANYDENNCLYANNGDGAFTKITTGAIVTDGGRSVGGSWGDYDSDGDLDLFVVNFNQNNFLYSNNGDGTFTKITTSVVVSDGGRSESGSWADYDNDGYLDLFVANNNENNFLYHNNGDGTFTKITTGGIVSDGGASFGCGWGDYNNDGYLDLYVANQNENNFLYANLGNGTFAKITTGEFVNDGGNSKGCSWGDYDHDGDLDLFVANYQENNFLYQNQGDGSFAKITQGPMVTDGGASYGSGWGDYDQDGNLDLFVANYGENNFLYHNNGDGTFSKIQSSVVVNDGGWSMGTAWCDNDKDGDLDLFVANNQQNNLLYANNGGNNNWINISCLGTISNASAIGAKVKIKAVINGNSVWQMREISAQTGFGSQNSLNAEFGLGDATMIDAIKVEWPSGITQVLTNVAVNQFLTITEPAAQFTDVTESTGVGDPGGSGGLALADYDNDGDIDIYVNNNNSLNTLYQNNGATDWNFTDVTTTAGVSAENVGGGSRFADYNNDGFADIFLIDHGGLAVFRNNGDGTFTDVADSSGITDANTTAGFSFGDYNKDGYLDIYLANWWAPDVLYKNNGPPDWNFTDVTSTTGINHNSAGQTPIFFDYDNDQDQDVYVTDYLNSNILYKNNGDGTFTDVTLLAGVNFGVRCRGAVCGDYDNDGDLDIYITRGGGQGRYENVLYRNNGAPDWNFTEVTDSAGVGNPGDGFNSVLGDYDNDGDLDIYVANSWNNQTPQNVLYQNNGDGTFTDVSIQEKVTSPDGCINANFFDYNNDGFLDIYAANTRGSNILYKNNGNNNNWLKIKPVGLLSNRAAVGTRLIVVGSGFRQIREVYGYNLDLPLHIGLGNAVKVDSLIIKWPNGVIQYLANVNVNQTITITEPYFRIHTIKDVLQDQGKQVRVVWDKVMYDGDSDDYQITNYALWRRVDVLSASKSSAQLEIIPAATFSEMLKNGVVSGRPSRYVVAQGKYTAGELWDFIATIPAHHSDQYAYIAPTLADSTAAGIPWSVFFVSAHTPDPDIFFDCWPDSGYSVDNLPPSVPEQVSVAEQRTETARQVVVSWQPVPDADLAYYGIYRNVETGSEAYGTTIDTFFVDTDVDSGAAYYYKVSAFDFSGNESDYSEESSIVVKVEDASTGSIPIEFALLQNYPNPFNPETTIRYQLPEASEVRFVIYNLLGEKIRTLEDDRQKQGFYTVRWDGADDHGRQVSSGVYFYRLEAGNFIETKKMLLLR